jgi:quercetin dioxygenase-like cupin family protein
MEKFDLNKMIKGWFVGDFTPTVLKTKDVEVSVKRYSKGDSELEHFHKIATEITTVISGKIKMCDSIFVSNDIIVLKPGQVTRFEALEDSVTVVVKHPGASNDKYTTE